LAVILRVFEAIFCGLFFEVFLMLCVLGRGPDQGRSLGGVGADISHFEALAVILSRFGGSSGHFEPVLRLWDIYM
jgi:hypothetical protein